MVYNFHLKILKTKNAFTIVELLVVVVVISILATITLVTYSSISSEAVSSSFQSDLSNASTKLKSFQVENGNYPLTIDCGLPDSSSNTCIKERQEGSYNYVVNNSSLQKGFCLSAHNETISYKVTDSSNPMTGDCDDYGLILDLDAGNSESYSGTGSTWHDLSGLNNDGSLINGITYTTDSGGAFSFDGVDDYVLTSVMTTEHIGNIEKSIEVWAKPNAIGSYMIYSTGQGGDNNNRVYSWSSGGLWYVNLGNNNSVSTGVPAVANEWVNITACIKNTVAKIYINGQYIHDKSFLPFTTQNSFILGRHGLSASYSYRGLVSKAKIFNRQLSATEVQQEFETYRGRYGI